MVTLQTTILFTVRLDSGYSAENKSLYRGARTVSLQEMGKSQLQNQDDITDNVFHTAFYVSIEWINNKIKH